MLIGVLTEAQITFYLTYWERLCSCLFIFCFSKSPGPGTAKKVLRIVPSSPETQQEVAWKAD